MASVTASSENQISVGFKGYSTVKFTSKLLWLLKNPGLQKDLATFLPLCQPISSNWPEGKTKFVQTIFGLQTPLHQTSFN